MNTWYLKDITQDFGNFSNESHIYIDSSKKHYYYLTLIFLLLFNAG